MRNNIDVLGHDTYKFKCTDPCWVTKKYGMIQIPKIFSKSGAGKGGSPPTAVSLTRAFCEARTTRGDKTVTDEINVFIGCAARMK